MKTLYIFCNHTFLRVYFAIFTKQFILDPCFVFNAFDFIKFIVMFLFYIIKFILFILLLLLYINVVVFVFPGLKERPYVPYFPISVLSF